MADGRRIYHKAWCGGGGAGVMMCACSARGSREAPGVMCVPLLQSLEADGGDIYHNAGWGRGGAWGFRGVNLWARRCRRASRPTAGISPLPRVRCRKAFVTYLLTYYHKAGCGRGGAWGFRGVNLCACACRCRRASAYEARFNT